MASLLLLLRPFSMQLQPLRCAAFITEQFSPDLGRETLVDSKPIEFRQILNPDKLL